MLRKQKATWVLIILVMIVMVVSCNKIDSFFHIGDKHDNTGFVFTASNESGTNSILIYEQQANGQLSYRTSVNSGGAGSGMPLGTQGALALDKKHRQLYTVNAGSNSISSFKLDNNGALTLHQTISSEGTAPVSLTVHNSILYVVNDGGNICGFSIADDGTLTKIEGSMQNLSSATADPAEILFKPDGSLLAVTEKATNKIAIFWIDAGGVAQPGEFYPAEAETPFGFVFAGGKYIVVTNAFGGAPGASTVTSFAVGGSPVVNLISNVPDHQSAACWVVLTKDEDYAFVTNTGSNSISSLKVGGNGTLELKDSVSVTTGKAPADITISGSGKFAYNVNGMSGSLGQYRILSGGRLKALGDLAGVPLSAAGLVAY